MSANSLIKGIDPPYPNPPIFSSKKFNEAYSKLDYKKSMNLGASHPFPLSAKV